MSVIYNHSLFSICQSWCPIVDYLVIIGTFISYVIYDLQEASYEKKGKGSSMKEKKEVICFISYILVMYIKMNFNVPNLRKNNINLLRQLLLTVTLNLKEFKF